MFLFSLLLCVHRAAVNFGGVPVLRGLAATRLAFQCVWGSPHDFDSASVVVVVAIANADSVITNTTTVSSMIQQERG